LPIQAQYAPINTIITIDVNKDGLKDILPAGNEYDYDAMTGRADASYGCFLINKGKGDFRSINMTGSGFITDGEVKSLKKIKLTTGKEIIVAAINNNNLKVFTRQNDNY
jgi:enediyne biosynthesis protein E4